MKKAIIAVAAVIFVLYGIPCRAGEIDIDLMGFSYHLHKNGSPKRAPNKLDHSGVLVFNPGVGVGYDFRENIHKGGLSPIVHGGFFQNCGNYPFFFAGGGARYRKFFFKKYFWEANLLGIMAYGNDGFDNKRYKLSVMPYANLGIGRDFGKYLLTLYLSYVPKDSGAGITQGTDMLFVNMSIAF